jgi:putative transcriptional regulator
MSSIEVHERTLAPGLLLAMPHLLDPNFHRAVVLMIEHNDEGSFGLIINRPSTMSVSSLLVALDMNWRGDNAAVVWTGGPVMPTSGWVLHEPSTRIGAGAPPVRTRFLLGYSGWGPGQLAEEMARGSWLHADPDPELIFETPAEVLWESALRSLGVSPEAIVQGSGIH